MQKRFAYISIIILILTSVSCVNHKKNDTLNLESKTELKTDSVEAYNELANVQNRKTLTISEYNTDNPEIETIERPQKTVIRNLTIDTTKAFGIWIQDPNGPHADFWLTK